MDKENRKVVEKVIIGAIILALTVFLIDLGVGHFGGDNKSKDSLDLGYIKIKDELGKLYSDGEFEVYMDRNYSEMKKEDFDYLYEIYKERFSNPFIYASNERFSYSQVQEDKYFQKDDGKKHLYTEVKVPNDLLKPLDNFYGSYISKEGFIDKVEGKLEHFNKTMINPNSEEGFGVESGQEEVSLSMFSNGNKKVVNLVGDTKKGYEGKGLPDYEIFENLLYTVYNKDKLFEDMKKSGYLIKAYNNTGDKYLIFDNSKKIEFMKTVVENFNNSQEEMTNLIKGLENYGFDVKDKLNPHYISLTCIQHDYEPTIDNMFSDYVRFLVMNNFYKDTKEQDRKKYNLFNNLNSLNEFKDNTISMRIFVQDEDKVRQIDDVRFFTDYVFTINSSYYEDLDKEDPYYNALASDKSDLESIKDINQACSIFNSEAGLTNTRLMKSLMKDINTEFNMRESVRDFEKKTGKKVDKSFVKGDLENIQKSRNDVDYSSVKRTGLPVNLDEDRIKKLDSFAYYLNKRVSMYDIVLNSASIDKDDYRFEDVHRDITGGKKFKNPIFRLLKTSEYVINSLVDTNKDYLSEYQTGEEQDQKNSQYIGEMNEKLLTLIKEGKIKHLSEGDGYYEVLAKGFDKDFTDSKFYKIEDGSETKLSENINENKNTIFIFSEYFCPYCKDTIKVVEQNKDLFKDYNVKIISTLDSSEDYKSLYDEIPEIKEILQGGLHVKEDLKDEIGIVYVPTIVGLDKNLRLVNVNYGFQNREDIIEFLSRNEDIIRSLNE